MDIITKLIKTNLKLNNKSLLKYYYGEIIDKIGSEYTDEDILQTDKVIDYLKESGYSVAEIGAELTRHKTVRIYGKDLTQNIYKNSLVKKGAFYLHRELCLISRPPEYDFFTNTVKNYPFYYEVKARYTVQNVLDYFYKQLSPLSRQMSDQKTDAKTVSYLMSKYSNIDYVEPLDIILCSIDRYIKDNPDGYKLIEISNNNMDIIKQLQSDMQSLEAKDSRKITWR